MTDGEADRVLGSLTFLRSVIEEVTALSEQVAERADEISEARRQGQSYGAIATAEEAPRLVAMMSRMIELLIDAGSQFRRAYARALYDEGVTMDQIAERFGVSRQRVSALLRAAGQHEEVLAGPVSNE
jgi:predicted DNA-binding ArsR family transcriptional regulator